MVWKQSNYCKRLPSHTGQEQACTRITWLVVRLFVHYHAENGWLHRQVAVDSTQYSPVHHSQSTTAHHSLIQPSKAQYSPVQSSTAQYSPAQPSTTKYTPLHSRTAKYSPVQTSTAKYSPVLPSTAQRSPLQPTTTSAGESIPPCIHLYTVPTVFCTEAPWYC